ncbi:MAG: hypothetical protein FD138_1316 [Planctomycetota bacterium]|nr:MAG: hypothetical protein FD138_1316 [Planctomycetota bacterium]
MTAAEIVKQLKPLGSEGYRKILRNHGVPEPMFGVKIEELKKIQKRVKRDYQLALDLYDTGIYDARYLAGLIADDVKMTKKDLCHWLETANCAALCDYTVAWVAAGSKHGRELALEWIDSKAENVATCGWQTLCGLVAIKDDAELDLAELKKLLQRVQKTIHTAPNNVRSWLSRPQRRSGPCPWTWATPPAKSRSPRNTSRRFRSVEASERSASRRSVEPQTGLDGLRQGVSA